MSDAPVRPVNVGLIGFGNHVVKNILRVFPEGGERRLAGVYVRDPDACRATYPALAGCFTGSLDAILSDPDIDVIYIATPTATHFDHAAAALAAGKPVWCEKPMTTCLADTRALVELAERQGLHLAEVAAYRHHAQFAWIRRLLQEKAALGERLIDVCTRFTIPALPHTDFRYSKAMGGGALLDVGFYPLSAAVALFGAPSRVAAVGRRDAGLDVDLSGSALLSYGDFACHAAWAIGGSYANEMTLNFERSACIVPRAFSKPADLVTRISVSNEFGQASDPVEIPADDQFDAMFNAFAATLRSGDRAVFARDARDAIANAELIGAVGSAMQSAR